MCHKGVEHPNALELGAAFASGQWVVSAVNHGGPGCLCHQLHQLLQVQDVDVSKVAAPSFHPPLEHPKVTVGVVPAVVAGEEIPSKSYSWVCGRNDGQLEQRVPIAKVAPRSRRSKR